MAERQAIMRLAQQFYITRFIGSELIVGELDKTASRG
jgi:hypothetical protein